ncbi:MAG TPA: maleylpyruvate isomerase N-terminal domain-containing protein [Actinomycetota bacterium]|nr:maleylpyruvate isomerase N-terminal domain-containing protein [Actinomycetota bacterium]
MAPIDPLEALRGECQRVSDVVLDLPEDDFARPTRCTEWNVKELVAHMFRDVLRVLTGLSEPAPEAADTTSVTYWRAYAPVDDARDIADRAKDIAAQHETGRAMAEAWTDLWRRSVALAEGADRERVVRTWAPALTLDDLLRTRVLEITVHGTDLAAALGRPAWATDDGMAITNATLLSLLGSDLPHELGWDGLTLMEKGTGRSGLTPDERAILGSAADVFPLIS